MSGYDKETGWCHFTPKKLNRYYRLIAGEPDNIEGRFRCKNIPFYFDRVGGIHAYCNDGELWTLLSGEPNKFNSEETNKRHIEDEYLVVSDIAINVTPNISAIKVNKIIELLGLQEKQDKLWVATAKGKSISKSFMSENESFGNKSFLKWKFKIIEIIQNHLDK